MNQVGPFMPLRELAERRRNFLHSRFRIPYSREVRGESRLVFVTPDFNRPAGGIRVMYDQVDALNGAGIAATIMHQRKGFRCSWFTNSTVVTSGDVDLVYANDVVVVPELYVDVLDRIGFENRHIILNQSGHLTWSINAERVASHLKRRRGLLGVVVPSRHIANYISFAFPGVKVEIARNCVDANLFFPGAVCREKSVYFLERRDTDDVHQMLRILDSRGSLDGWEIRPIRVSGQKQYAAALRAAQIFVSTPYQEGFGMPAVEAMAAGAYVVGYHGYGGREYFDPKYSRLADTGDVLGLAHALEGVLQNVEGDSDWCISRGRSASRFVSDYYSIENSRRDVVEAYAALAGGHES